MGKELRIRAVIEIGCDCGRRWNLRVKGSDKKRRSCWYCGAEYEAQVFRNFTASVWRVRGEQRVLVPGDVLLVESY